MVRISWLKLTAVGAIALGVTTFAHADTVIGDFETTALDAWGTDGGPGSPTLAQSTTGVTLHSNSLAATNPQGGFWGPSTGNLLSQGDLIPLETAGTVSYDLTLIGTQLSGDGSAFSGFAQSNEMSISVFSNPGGTLPGGVNAFIQKSFAAASGTDSSGHAAQWAGVDGTRTITYNLSAFTLTDPTTSATVTLAQFLVAHPDTQDVKINFVEQLGGGNAPGTAFFDNVKLISVPEPASLGLLGLGSLLGLRRRK